MKNKTMEEFREKMNAANPQDIVSIATDDYKLVELPAILSDLYKNFDNAYAQIDESGLLFICATKR